MPDLRNILVIIEPDEEAQLALSKALRLARHSGAALELVICDGDSGLLHAGQTAEELSAARAAHIDRHQQLLEKMADVIRQQGFTVKGEALWADKPHEAIVNKVLVSQPDLLVHSTHPRDKLSRLLLSHQDWQLLRYCPCPLLLVKDRPWLPAPAIVVAIDPVHAHAKPAALDQRLTAAGALLADELGGTVHLFHSTYRSGPLDGDARDAEIERVRELASELLAASEIPADQLHISDEDIQRSLPRLLSELSAGVLVMGAVSRSGLERFLVGNTAEKILDRVEQDVLVVKPQGFTDKVRKATPASL